MEKAFIELMSHIQGMDAAILAICIVIYKVIMHSKKGDEADALLGIQSVTKIAYVLIVARTLITLFPYVLQLK